MNLREELFGNIDFNSIQTNPDFKEDSIPEVIILPILHKLGYTEGKMERFYKVGQ